MQLAAAGLTATAPLFALAMAIGAAPVAAQETYRSRTVVVFGTDACPTSSNPDEIIVCARRPEEERYRIPRELREQERAAAIAREDRVGENRAALASGRASAGGIGSCSAVGAGGGTGCTRGIDIVGGARTAVQGVQKAAEPVDD